MRTAPAVSKITHEAWQQVVVDLAHLLGWEHLHVRPSIGKGRHWTTTTNVVGWPDLWLWKAGRGFVAIELKVHPDKPRPEQHDVLVSLRAAGAVTMVAYPEDLPLVQAILQNRPERVAS